MLRACMSRINYQFATVYERLSPSLNRLKNLESDAFGLEALQPFEIPQNGQRNFW